MSCHRDGRFAYLTQDLLVGGNVLQKGTAQLLIVDVGGVGPLFADDI
jgi:hypothetical protein